MWNLPTFLPRALRLDRLHKGALHTVSHEDIRDIRNSTGSQDGPVSNPSSSNSSQDSLHKAPKKKGIKSSFGRLFGKKEKGRPGQTGKEALGQAGVSETDNPSQDALGLSKLGGQAEKKIVNFKKSMNCWRKPGDKVYLLPNGTGQRLWSGWSSGLGCQPGMWLPAEQT